MKMCTKLQICIIKTVGGDVYTRFCLEEEKEEAEEEEEEEE